MATTIEKARSYGPEFGDAPEWAEHMETEWQDGVPDDERLTAEQIAALPIFRNLTERLHEGLFRLTIYKRINGDECCPGIWGRR